MGIGAGFCCCSTTTTTTPPTCPCPFVPAGSWTLTRLIVRIEGVAVGTGCSEGDCDCAPVDAIGCLMQVGYCLWQGHIKPSAYIDGATTFYRFGTFPGMWCDLSYPGFGVWCWVRHHAPSNKMLLEIFDAGNTMVASYSLAAGSFSCSGTNVLTKDASPTYAPCTFPATVTIESSSLSEGDEDPFVMARCHQCWPCDQATVATGWNFELSGLSGNILPADHPEAAGINPNLCDCSKYNGSYCMDLMLYPSEGLNLCEWTTAETFGGVVPFCYCYVTDQISGTHVWATSCGSIPPGVPTEPPPGPRPFDAAWRPCCEGTPFFAGMRIDGGVVYLNIAWSAFNWPGISAAVTYVMSSKDFNCNGTNVLELACTHTDAQVGILCEDSMPSTLTIYPVSGGCTSTTTTSTTTTTCPPKVCYGGEAGKYAVISFENISDFLCSDCNCNSTFIAFLPAVTQDFRFQTYAIISHICVIQTFGVETYWTVQVVRLGAVCYLRFSIQFSGGDVVSYIRPHAGFLCDGTTYVMTKERDTQQLCVLPLTVELTIVDQTINTGYWPCDGGAWVSHNYTGTVLGVSVCLNSSPIIPGEWLTSSFSAPGYSGDVFLSSSYMNGFVSLRIEIHEDATTTDTVWIYVLNKHDWNCLGNNTLNLLDDECYYNFNNGTLRQNLLISPPASVAITYASGACP